MAATIAHSGAPPSVGPADTGAKQRFVILRDWAITFSGHKSYHDDGDFSTHMTNAIEYFRLGEATVRVQKCGDPRNGRDRR